jgi:hypothetical protein
MIMLSRARTPRPLLAAFSLVWAAGCSTGNAQVAGDAGSGFTKIDDMEGDGGFIEWTPPAGLGPGVWYTATDCSETGNIFPLPAIVGPNGLVPSIWSYATLPSPHETFPGIVSTRAARLRTTAPLVGVWGANMDLALSSMPGLSVEVVPPAGVSDGGAMAPDASIGPQGCPIILGNEGAVDLSAYSGITFWAMGDPTGARTVQVMFQDRNTAARGGICNYSDSNSPDYCYNGFATTIGLTDTFTRYTIAFSSLQQNPNWGYRPNPDLLDLQHVHDIYFQINAPVCYVTEMCVGGAPPPVTFDFWIDDLYFVNK